MHTRTTEGTVTDIMDLANALTQFDRTMANLELLQQLWERYEKHIPNSPAFGLDTPEIDQIRREFADIAASLPAIDGEGLAVQLSALDDLSQLILDYMEIGLQVEGYRTSQDEAYSPKRQLDDYQYRVIKKRRILVQRRVEEVVAMVDDLLRSSLDTNDGREFPDDVDGWSLLRELTGELDRLKGAEALSNTRIRDFRRHMRFAEPCDLSDIVEEDWPSVRAALVDPIFEGEPLPVAVEDLGDLVRSEPTGSVTSRLAWEQLNDEDFERLVFDLLHSADSYENVEWLMKPNAPDRGRDISADRVSKDDLSATRRIHVLFQCRHWQSRSIGISELQTLLAEVGLWSKNFAVVVMATSGRFTQDAVEWRETREFKGVYPAVEFWPDSHLEHLLASRPALRSNHFRDL